MLSFKPHRLLLAPLVTGLLLFQGCGEGTATQNAAMEAAPDFALTLFDGGAFRLSERNVGLTIPAGLDRTGEIKDAFELYGMPTTFFIDKDGMVS